MATRSLKARVELDGEKQYKQALSELNQGNKVLASEMQKLQAEYKNNTESTEFLTKKDSKDVYYVLTGTIKEIANPTYGNIYITDANGDDVYVYGLLPGYGATGDAKKGLVEAKGLKVGDTITIVGNKASYKGDPQVGNAVYLSHESN